MEFHITWYNHRKEGQTYFHLCNCLLVRMTGTTLTQGYSHMNTNRKELLVVTLTLVHLDNPNVAVKKKKACWVLPETWRKICYFRLYFGWPKKFNFSFVGKLNNFFFKRIKTRPWLKVWKITTQGKLWSAVLYLLATPFHIL